MAGGSQIIINKNGITVITPGKFEVKAGQHLFKGGAHVQSVMPSFSSLATNKDNYSFTNRIDVFDVFKDFEFSEVKYRALLKDQKIYKSGVLDEHGRTERFASIDNKQEELQVVIDDPDYEWLITDEDFQEEVKNKED